METLIAITEFYSCQSTCIFFFFECGGWAHPKFWVQVSCTRRNKQNGACILMCCQSVIQIIIFRNEFISKKGSLSKNFAGAEERDVVNIDGQAGPPASARRYLGSDLLKFREEPALRDSSRDRFQTEERASSKILR